jgi:hypothetical protein
MIAPAFLFFSSVGFVIIRHRLGAVRPMTGSSG